MRSYGGLTHSKPINTFLSSITQAYHLLPYSLCTCTLDNQFKDLTFKFIYRWMQENWRKERALYSGQHGEGRWMNKSLNRSVNGFGFYCTHAIYTLSYVAPWNLAQLFANILEKSTDCLCKVSCNQTMVWLRFKLLSICYCLQGEWKEALRSVGTENRDKHEHMHNSQLYNLGNHISKPAAATWPRCP